MARTEERPIFPRAVWACQADRQGSRSRSSRPCCRFPRKAGTLREPHERLQAREYPRQDADDPVPDPKTDVYLLLERREDARAVKTWSTRRRAPQAGRYNGPAEPRSSSGSRQSRPRDRSTHAGDSRHEVSTVTPATGRLPQDVRFPHWSAPLRCAAVFSDPAPVGRDVFATCSQALRARPIGGRSRAGSAS